MNTDKMADAVVRSFEEGALDAGDILSVGKQKRSVKIGLLTLGYFEYWRMYPALKQKVESDLARITARIKSEYVNVVASGMVDTLDRADEAGRLFRAENVDMVLLVCGTYAPDFISLTALDYVRDKQLVIFSVQAHDNVDRAGTYEESLRNSGVIGSSQLTGTLAKMKRKFKVVVGSVDDSRAYGRIAKFVAAQQAVEDLREANIGIIGHVFRGMYDIEVSKTFLKSVFGVNVILIQPNHLLDIWRDVTDDEVTREAETLTNRFSAKHVTDDDVRRAVRLAIAMEKVAARFRLDAMCFLDQHYVQRQVLTSARIGASLMMERTHMCVNCEGDLGGLVTMMLMKSISKHSPLMAEWGEYDLQTNSCLLIGHGIGTPELAVNDDAVTLTRTPEEWGFEGAGLNYELIVKPGAATIGHILEAPEGYRLMYSRVESIAFPKLAFDELHALVSVKKPVTEYLEEVFDYGVSHHCILSLGDIAEELGIAADILGIGKFYTE